MNDTTKKAPLTGDELAAMMARCEAATPGPWVRHMEQDGELLPDGTGSLGDLYETTDIETEGGEYSALIGSADSGADAAFIAHAREDMPRLLGALNEANEDMDRLRGTVAALGVMVRLLLASAVPHPIEHPTMFAAWEHARAMAKEMGIDVES